MAKNEKFIIHLSVSSFGGSVISTSEMRVNLDNTNNDCALRTILGKDWSNEFSQCILKGPERKVEELIYSGKPIYGKIKVYLKRACYSRPVSLGTIDYNIRLNSVEILHDRDSGISTIHINDLNVEIYAVKMSACR